MAKGVKKGDYKASAAELENAKVAQSAYQKFKTTYAPLLKQRAVDSQSDAIKTTLRGRANADAMQKMNPQIQGMGAANSTSVVGAAAEGLAGQLGEAGRVARAYQNNQGADTLARGRQMAGTAQEGLAQVSRLGTSTALAKAQAKEAVAQSKINALAKVGSAFVSTGMENFSQTGDFLTPGVLDTKAISPDGQPKYNAATDWKTRLSAGLGRL